MATDRERNLPDYRAIPSLQDILVVSSSEPRIEHFRREQGGWRIHDLRGQGSLRLQTLDLTLDVAELYAGVLDAPGNAGETHARAQRLAKARRQRAASTRR